MAYIKNIDQNTSDSHQASPGYVLTFIRWKNRDTFNYDNEDLLAIRNNFVVVNDATHISVSCTKNSPSPTFQCSLRAGDINYLTAVHPGDFVIVNMLNWEKDAMLVRQKAIDGNPINKKGDGFKGVFKIQDVRMQLVIQPNGQKGYSFNITGKGFDELNSLLYFNPAIIDADKKANPLFFLRSFGENWNNLVQKRNTNNVENLIKNVIKSTIGMGTKNKDRGDTPQNQISRYLMPPGLGKLLNRTANNKGILNASDINNYYLGIWGVSPEGKGVKPEDGFNSFSKSDDDGNFFKTTIELTGSRRVLPQDFQNVQVWSLLKNYSNTTLNEVYATYRLAKDGYVYPAIVVRQKPFNTQHFNVKNPKYKEIADHTKFLDLPRWKISPDLITKLNIGRNDSARINFVQVFTRSLAIDDKFNQSLQISKGNYIWDEKDIKRSGMKPYIVSCNYDYPDAKAVGQGQKWADLVGDWLLEGHLKMNGSIESIGIEDPICIGDNLQLSDTVYHIESVNHTMTISPDGKKTFRTNCSLSMGVSVDSTSKIPVYAEMDHTDSFTNRQKDHDIIKDKILPGFSDTQDIPSRSKGEEIKETRQASFTNPTKKDKA